MDIEAKVRESYQNEIARLKAQRDRYRAALKRLATAEAFDGPGAVDPEMRMRMIYAEESLKG